MQSQQAKKTKVTTTVQELLVACGAVTRLIIFSLRLYSHFWRRPFF